MLIERSPGDAWLSICGLIFLGHCISSRNWSWLKIGWVKFTFLFWAVCIVSALLSELPFYSLGEAIAWFRFPLFAFASCFYFCRSREIFYAMAILDIHWLVIDDRNTNCRNFDCGSTSRPLILALRGSDTRQLFG